MSPLSPRQPIENTDRVSDRSLWISQPPQRGGGCLVPSRQVRRRRAYAWTQVLPAGALAIGEFGGSRLRLWRMRGSLSLSIGFPWPVRYLIPSVVPETTSSRNVGTAQLSPLYPT